MALFIPSFSVFILVFPFFSLLPLSAMTLLKSIVFGLLLFAGSFQVHAQKTYSEKSYLKNPHWIEMMEDTLANYNEIQKAFGLYFEKHELPKEEDEIIGMRSADEEEKKSKESWLKRVFSKSRSMDENELAFAVKKYKHWLLMTEPWVQVDGRILYPNERKKILDSIRR